MVNKSIADSSKVGRDTASSKVGLGDLVVAGSADSDSGDLRCCWEVSWDKVRHMDALYELETKLRSEHDLWSGKDASCMEVRASLQF